MPGTRSALDQASAATRQRIAADTRKLPIHLRPGLETIGARLFDPDLTFQRARESHGIRAKNTAATFRQALGLPPAQYIRERRMEVAAELLRRTRLPAWRVGVLVGYLQHQSFSRAFKGWARQAPMPFRKVEVKLAEAARPSPGAGSAWLVGLIEMPQASGIATKVTIRYVVSVTWHRPPVGLDWGSLRNLSSKRMNRGPWLFDKASCDCYAVAFDPERGRSLAGRLVWVARRNYIGIPSACLLSWSPSASDGHEVATRERVNLG